MRITSGYGRRRPPNALTSARGIAVAIVAGLAVLSTSAGNRINAAEQEFEVASIRPSDPQTLTPPRRMGPLLFEARGSLKDLIELAFKLEDYQVVGGPGWIGSERYDVRAKATSSVSADQIPGMLAVLLKDRFKLQVHSGSQSMAAYVMTVVPKGAKLKAAEAGTPRDGRGAIQKTSSGVITRGSTMGLFARFLTMEVGRPVLDHTGLDGAYDINLTYDDLKVTDSSAGRYGSVFSALSDIGLKLKPEKTPVPVLIVDAAQPPSPD